MKDFSAKKKYMEQKEHWFISNITPTILVTWLISINPSVLCLDITSFEKLFPALLVPISIPKLGEGLVPYVHRQNSKMTRKDSLLHIIPPTVNTIGYHYYDYLALQSKGILPM